MTEWTAFAAITGVVLVLLLVLSTLTQSAFEETDRESDPADSASRTERDARPEPTTGNATGDDSRSASADDEGVGPGPPARSPADGEAGGDDRSRTVDPAARSSADRGVDPESLTTGMVLANVAVSQGLFALVLVGAAIYTGVPADALGIEFSRSYLETGLVLGTAFGVVLYLGNELGAATATRFGFDHDEQLRELLAPDSTRGWLVLLGVVLPIIAVFEELLFRAALIGAIEAGFGVSPWLLAVVSSVAFAVGHGVQGSVGVVVTGVLGFVLAAIFVVTGSFLVVVVAHYVINALEFVVHEGFDVEWAEILES